MILIRKSKTSHGYLPVHDRDLSVFKHCCEGQYEVRNIALYIPVFNMHGHQVMIQDETCDQSNVDQPGVGGSSEYRDNTK